MAEPLTPAEEAALRRLEREVAHDDPELAGRFRTLSPARAPARSWARWPVWWWLLAGGVLLVSGTGLDVRSAACVGLALIGVGGYRSAPGRRAVRAARESLVHWWRSSA